MKIAIVTPAPAGSSRGNRVTADRWARILRGLGHRVSVLDRYDDRRADLLVALHAGRSAPAVRRFRRLHPDAPVFVALTGTDLYGTLATSPAARRSLEDATRLLLLQPLGTRALPRRHRGKARVVLQSAERVPALAPGPRGAFVVCVLGHLRAVKDPFRAARAARLLPPSSKVRVVHLGEALEPGYARRARREESRNPRYRWLGAVPRRRALALLAGSRLLVQSSILEGGANAVGEAIAAGVPVVSSRVPGSVGLLGPRYPGYFPVGDSRALATLLRRAETDRAFYADLRRRCRRLAPAFAPARERRAWSRALAELARADGRP